MQSSHASANGGVGGGMALVSSWCRWCHSRVILRVHALSIHRCHSRVILSSRVILGCPVIRLPLMSESYECTNAAHRSISWCDSYMVSIVGWAEGTLWHRTLSKGSHGMGQCSILWHLLVQNSWNIYRLGYGIVKYGMPRVYLAPTICVSWCNVSAEVHTVFIMT